ncbi:RidA family protein [Alkalihalobacillus oceani]|uniref:RidA family protein n=1 Tax=Halalkalibacter oceani TaxID=1653776 RepID=UPI00203A7F84|nr:RidA family protein [Halalkalibacter oceani]MCM3762097.1 RidA family protein [Halalkalibacter oceani]
MNYEQRLEKAGYPVPTHVSNRAFKAGVETGNLLFISGHAAKVNGVLKYEGIVGDTITLEQAQDAAKIALVNCLAAVRNMKGTLHSIKRIVNIKGYVASTTDFVQQPEVMDEVSRLVNEVFGDIGEHSRVALGTASLPGGTPVEIEMVVEV